jgi:excisionase family DNA binding protein
MATLLTTREVQELLQVDRTTIYRMVESRRLPAVRVGKQWRFARPEIERWLQSHTVSGMVGPGTLATPAPGPATPAADAALADMLPLACSQLIQDAFADVLGVLVVITDMQGTPIDAISNPGEFLAAVYRTPVGAAYLAQTWGDLAAGPEIQPRFVRGAGGLLFARGLIRVKHSLCGMVVLGGLAPDVWPPEAAELAELAAATGLDPAELSARAVGVHYLDATEQSRVLRSAQRIADIFAHIAEDRQALCGRLEAIASLTAL